MSNPEVAIPSDQNASGRQLGEEEIAALGEAIASGCLTGTKGTFVKKLQTRFAEHMGVAHAHACSSGTAAIHTAVAAIDPSPGDEIITTSITDMGGLSPIVYQGAIPVFADVDPDTVNVTADSIEARLSDRTKAIIVTHLFGLPCDMGPIMELANARGIPVIEDCAQAYDTRYRGQLVGTFGAIGCFSLQQGKHITTGEGGLVISNDDALARRCFLYINKAWGYGDKNADHYFLALNYRMNELAGAVALAQLAKLSHSVEVRRAMAARLSAAIGDLPGVQLPVIPEGCHPTWWKYSLMVDGDVVPGGPVAMAGALREFDIFSAPRYIQKPAFQCQVFRDQVTFGDSHWPFDLARPEAVDYSEALFPGTFKALRDILVLPINEGYDDKVVDYIAARVRDTHAALTGGAA